MHDRTPRYTAAERCALVDKQRRSGLSATAFCRQHALVYQTFMGWRRRLSGAHQPSTVAAPRSAPSPNALPDFIELGVSESADTGAPPVSVEPTWLVELDLGTGMTLRIRQPA